MTDAQLLPPEMSGLRRIVGAKGLARLLGAMLFVHLELTTAAQADAVGAIGQIVPAGGIVEILGTPGSRVTAILVHAGQFVKAGTLLLTTQAVSPNSDVVSAKVQLDAARALATQQVTSQTAAVRLAEAARAQAAAALAVYQRLGATIVSKKELDRLRNASVQANLALEAERAKLKVVGTQSDSALQSAQRQYDLALQAAELRSPIDGTVLRINATVGSQLGNDPTLQLGDLRAMYVICQVYEGDVLSIRPGMTATVKAHALNISLRGHVEEVGRLIDTKSRLAQVQIRLDKAEPANRLVGMEVDVSIDR